MTFLAPGAPGRNKAVYAWLCYISNVKKRPPNAVTFVSSASITVGISQSSLLILVLMVLMSTSLCDVRLQVNAFLFKNMKDLLMVNTAQIKAPGI